MQNYKIPLLIKETLDNHTVIILLWYGPKLICESTEDLYFSHCERLSNATVIQLHEL